MLMSMWTTHATGMSMAEPPPPPPPAPDPVMVTFSLDKGHYLEALPGRNAATAKASVNPKIMVESNSDAIITPTWMDDANGVSVMEGDNMPFGRVDWELLQSKVLDEGATFMIQRATLGANQEMEPKDDVAYVTCGPFECSESSNDGPPPVPVPSIANSPVCNDFETADAILQVGFVDNDGANISPTDYTASTDATAIANDGVDVGWVTDSKVAMTVKHHFSGVARGKNFSATGVEAKKGSSMALAMTNHVQGATATSTTINDADFEGALLVGTLADGGTDGLDPCADDEYTEPRAGLHKPDSCFRVTAAGDAKTGINYLGGYSIEFAAEGAGVSWGNVARSPDPFKDLKCESKSFMATEVMEADVCDLFEDEVDAAMAKKWGGSKGTTVTFLGGDSSTVRPPRSTGYSPLSATASLHLLALQIEAPAAESRRFASLWYNDNDKRTDSKDNSNHNLYADAAAPLHIELVDEDGDPKYGDFGKVDFAKKNAAGTAHVLGEDGTAESPAGGESKCVHSDGEGCDSMLEETITVTFDAGLAIGCSPKREVTISCEWDASGERTSYRQDDHATAVTLDTVSSDGLTSTFTGFLEASSSGRGPAGSVDAFVSCKVSAN